MGSLNKFRKAPHGMTFGVEIECNPIVEIHPDIYMGFFYVTTDGSLRSYGREFVSQPMPYDMLARQIQWLAKRVPWEVDNRCGLHIHVSRKMWSNARQEAFSDFLRDAFRGSETSHLEKWFGRYSNYADPFAGRSDKFRAINLLHPASYEFRVWKAGDVAWTLEALRRTREIVRYQGEWTKEVMERICGNSGVAKRDVARVVHQPPDNPRPWPWRTLAQRELYAHVHARRAV